MFDAELILHQVRSSDEGKLARQPRPANPWPGGLRPASAERTGSPHYGSDSFLLRDDASTFSWLLFHEPPRSTGCSRVPFTAPQMYRAGAFVEALFLRHLFIVASLLRSMKPCVSGHIPTPTGRPVTDQPPMAIGDSSLEIPAEKVKEKEKIKGNPARTGSPQFCNDSPARLQYETTPARTPSC